MMKVRHLMACKNISACTWPQMLTCISLCGGKITVENYKCPQICKEMLRTLNERVMQRDMKELKDGVYFGVSFDETHSQSEQSKPILSTSLRSVFSVVDK